MEAPRRGFHRRTAQQRREQSLRAEARVVQRMLAGFGQLAKHRGSQPTQLGAALHAALQCSSEKSSQLCKHYAAGRCTRGAACRFSHVACDATEEPVADQIDSISLESKVPSVQEAWIEDFSSTGNDDCVHLFAEVISATQWEFVQAVDANEQVIQALESRINYLTEK
jgi:hypothetical protein